VPTFEIILRLLLAGCFFYLGIDTLITGKIKGMSNMIPFMGKGVYANGKPYFTIKGKIAYIIALIQILAGVYLLLMIVI
jgi:hypothetical protein